MKKVYPVRFQRKDTGERSTYFIVAENVEQAEEIAFSCIANNPPPRSAGPARPSSYGRGIANVWVMDSWAQDTRCKDVGLIGTGSEILIAKALALYVEKYNKLH